MNKAIMSGRLCADIELRQTPNGKNVCAFTLAVDRRGKDAGADFIDCVAWEKTAEFLARYFQKGQQMNICGRLQTRSYEDKEGKKRKATEIVVEEVGFCGKAEGKAQSTPAEFLPMVSDDGDLPF
jgi:single-strand DNA-binding protein